MELLGDGDCALAEEDQRAVAGSHRYPCGGAEALENVFGYSASLASLSKPGMYPDVVILHGLYHSLISLWNLTYLILIQGICHLFIFLQSLNCFQRTLLTKVA